MPRPNVGRAALSACALAALVLAACGTSGAGKGSRTGSGTGAESSSTTAAGRGGPASTEGGAVPLVGTNWVLTGYADASGGTVAAVRDAEPASLKLDASGRFSGSNGCNAITGTYKLDGTSLTFTLGPSTLRACADPAANAQESAVNAALAKVRSYTLTGQKLTLDAGPSQPLLAYAGTSAALAGTKWSVTGVNNGKGAVESNALTPKLTAEFTGDNKFGGFGGCNQLNGPYTTDGTAALTIGPVASTRRACEPDVMALEAAYLAALGRVATYELRGDQITMRAADGAAQVTAKRAG